MAIDPSILTGGSPGPVAFNLTPQSAAKVLGSVVVGTVGYWYLTTSRKRADLGGMIKGALLILASLFFFF